jgi:hypothetical protein
VQPESQGVYRVVAGADLAPGDTSGLLVSAPAAALLGNARVGDTIMLAGRLDPQIAAAGEDRALVVRGMVEWLYDFRGQPSVGAVLPVMQRLARQSTTDPASLVLVRARSDSMVEPLVSRLRARYPTLEVNSVVELVAQARRRLAYFTQLSHVLGAMSLVVTVLLIGTLLTITVNERLGEIATLRAIGLGRATIVRQVLAEGIALTAIGSILGVLLGLATARYLDAILTSFPGLPAAFSFFVPRADTLTPGRDRPPGDRLPRRTLPRLARGTGAHRGHLAGGGDLSAPVHPDAVLVAHDLRKDYPVGGGDGPCAARCLALGLPRRARGDRGTVGQRQVHPVAAPGRDRHAVGRLRGGARHPVGAPVRPGAHPASPPAPGLRFFNASTCCPC